MLKKPLQAPYLICPPDQSAHIGGQLLPVWFLPVAVQELPGIISLYQFIYYSCPSDIIIAVMHTQQPPYGSLN